MRDEIEEIRLRKADPDNEVPLDVWDARLEEIDFAFEAYDAEGEELSNEECAIDSFDWSAWEQQKEMQSWAREREEEEEEIRAEMSSLG